MIKKALLFSASLSAFIVLLNIAGGRSASALITNQFIEPANAAGYTLVNTVVESTDAVGVPTSSLKWFIDSSYAGNPSITMQGFCAAGNSAAYVQFEQYTGAPWTLVSLGPAISAGNFNNLPWTYNACVGNDLVISGIPNSWFQTQGGLYPNYKVLLVDIILANPAPFAGNINQFRAIVDTRYISQAELGIGPSLSLANPGGGNAFAILGTKVNSYGYEITFNFATTCDVGAAQDTYYLHWRDEDYDKSYGNGTWFDLVDTSEPPTDTFWQQFGPLPAGNPAYGTSNAYGVWPVQLKKGHVYAWQWHNVNNLNTLHVFMPFSEITSAPGFSCEQPPNGALQSVDCQNNWVGWAADPDNTGWNIRVHLYLDGPAGAGIDLGYYGTGQPNAAANAAGYPGNHGFSIPAPPAYMWGAHTVYAYAVGIDSGGTENGVIVALSSSPQSYAACVPPTPTVICNPSAANAITFDQNEYSLPGTMTTHIINNTAGGSPPSITVTSVTYTAGLSLIGGSTTTPNPVGSGGGTANITQGVSFPAPNTYVVTATINYSATLANGALYSSSLNCSGTINIYAKPYVKSYGADIWAGGAFEGACNTNAGVYGFAKLNGVSYSGASSQFGIFALLNINEFYSASNRTAPNMPPKGLSFSNTAGNGTYGGAYGAGCLTISDYFSDPATSPPGGGTRTSLPTTNIGNITATFASSPLGTSQHSINPGNILGGSSFVVPAGKQIAVYVDGDAYLDSNISYSPAVPGNAKDIPYLALIVRGNIYIAPGVSRLDGLYVAQPLLNGTKGKIYTCATSTGPYSVAAVYSNCITNRLTVNGALVAQQVKFLRTLDTLNASTINEVPATARAAEIINFTPELFIAPSPLRDPNATPGTKTYDAIFSLPPVF